MGRGGTFGEDGLDVAVELEGVGAGAEVLVGGGRLQGAECDQAVEGCSGGVVALFDVGATALLELSLRVGRQRLA